jgi:hypothetical protein
MYVLRIGEFIATNLEKKNWSLSSHRISASQKATKSYTSIISSIKKEFLNRLFHMSKKGCASKIKGTTFI